jgi:hypothetical protein
MKVVAEAVLENGGSVAAVVPSEMKSHEVVNDGISCVTTVATVEERKRKIQELSDAFLVLPGGIGVMDELFFIYSEAKLGKHRKPIGVLNTEGFFSPIISLLKSMALEKFIKEKHLELIKFGNDPSTLLDEILNVKSL